MTFLLSAMPRVASCDEHGGKTKRQVTVAMEIATLAVLLLLLVVLFDVLVVFRLSVVTLVLIVIQPHLPAAAGALKEGPLSMCAGLAGAPCAVDTGQVSIRSTLHHKPSTGKAPAMQD